LQKSNFIMEVSVQLVVGDDVQPSYECNGQKYICVNLCHQLTNIVGHMGPYGEVIPTPRTPYKVRMHNHTKTTLACRILVDGQVAGLKEFTAVFHGVPTDIKGFPAGSGVATFVWGMAVPGGGNHATGASADKFGSVEVEFYATEKYMHKSNPNANPTTNDPSTPSTVNNPAGKKNSLPENMHATTLRGNIRPQKQFVPPNRDYEALRVVGYAIHRVILFYRMPHVLVKLGITLPADDLAVRERLRADTNAMLDTPMPTRKRNQQENTKEVKQETESVGKKVKTEVAAAAPSAEVTNDEDSVIDLTSC
jgi:hypothetical protein